ncbi:MAG: uracil-DNA glycosylase family protein [Rhodobacteraceae bacterium]|nr:uracil-DNA glycosylase family protein [Paracoccaceae bacterium]
MAPTDTALAEEIRACRLCAARFAATATAHPPRPVVWFRPGARLLIAGQAPGLRVHEAGRPFADASGDRLRDWLGLTATEFYDLHRVAVVPMAFCFPGYDAKGSDLPPPPLCAATWHAKVMAALPGLRLRVLVGGHAFGWHLGAKGVTATVARWREVAAAGAPVTFPLPHPSWRNTAWLKRNPWFEADLLPVLRAEVRRVMETP